MKKQGRRSHARAHMWQGEKRAVLLPAYRASWIALFTTEGDNIKIAPKTEGQYLWNAREAYKELEEPAILFDGKIMYIDHPYVVTTTPVIHKFQDTTPGARFPHVYITERTLHVDNTNETLYHPFKEPIKGVLRYDRNRYNNGQYRSESPLYEVSSEELDIEFDIKFDEESDRRTLRKVTAFLFSKIGEEGGEEGGVPKFAAGLRHIQRTLNVPYWPPRCG